MSGRLSGGGCHGCHVVMLPLRRAGCSVAAWAVAVLRQLRAPPLRQPVATLTACWSFLGLRRCRALQRGRACCCCCCCQHCGSGVASGCQSAAVPVNVGDCRALAPARAFAYRLHSLWRLRRAVGCIAELRYPHPSATTIKDHHSGSRLGNGCVLCNSLHGRGLQNTAYAEMIQVPADCVGYGAPGSCNS